MKYLKQFFLPLLLVIFSFLFLCFSRIVPVSKLWKGYSVMYVPLLADKSIVYKTFSENGVDSFLSIDNQVFPLPFSQETPEVSLASSGDSSESYLKQRIFYFFDKSKQFNLIYIPDEFSSEAFICQGILNNNYGIKAGINLTSSFPVICPIIVFLFSIFLIYFSENKILSSVSFIFPLFYSFCVPFYTVCASLCLFMYALFFFLKLWNRNGAIKVLISNIYSIVLFSVSLLSVIFSGIKPFLLFLVMLLGFVSLLFLYRNLVFVYEKKRFSFIPVKIRSAKMVRLENAKTNFCMLVCSVSIFTVFIFALFSQNFSFGNTEKAQNEIKLPSACAGVKELPDLNDYADWRWKALIYPYVSVYENKKIKNPENGEKISFTDFYKDEKSGLIASEKKQITYGKNSAEEAVLSIQNIKGPSIEKILLKQGKCRPGYICGKSENLSFFSILILLISLSIPTFFYVSTKNKLSLRGKSK